MGQVPAPLNSKSRMSIITKIKHFFHPIQGEIWCLHRVVRERSLFPSNRELEIKPDFLERMITDYQRQGFQFVSIDDIVSSIGCKQWNLRRNKQVNVSFDDGFKDIYENAFPIFKKYHIPFTVYLVGSFPEGQSDLWWIQLERLMGEDVEAFEELMRKIYHSDRNMRDVMHAMTASTKDPSLCKELSLTWEQLQEMIDSGLCSVGCHSMTHPGLTRIPDEEVYRELSEGRRIIESKLSVKIKHFSYPHSMENSRIQTILKETGFESATLGFGGTIRKGDNLYRLNRKYIVQP